jgi:hypothetical protein
MTDLPSVLVVIGATGSGKSKIGIEVAARVHGEVVNADSLQVHLLLLFLIAGFFYRASLFRCTVDYPLQPIKHQRKNSAAFVIICWILFRLFRRSAYFSFETLPFVLYVAASEGRWRQRSVDLTDTAD